MKPHSRQSAPQAAQKRNALSEISFFIGRAYYNYIGLLSRLLAAEGLDVCLRPGMGHILFALFEKNDQVIRDLAARVQLSPSTMTGILKQMERMRLITRRRDGEDGRAVRVRLTDLAWSLEPRCARILDKLNRILQSGLSAEEVQYVKEGLEKMVSNMRQGEEHSSEALEKQKNGVQMIEIVTAGRSKASPPVNLSDRRKVQ